MVSTLTFTGCNSESEHKETPNSETNRANEGENTDGASRKAMGTAEGDQNEGLGDGHPDNQQNLHPDSTRDTTQKKLPPRP